METQQSKKDEYMREYGIEETGFGSRLTDPQKEEMENLIKKYPDQSGLGKQVLGKIAKNPAQIHLTLEKPYPPIARKVPYPASPRKRVEI